MSPSAKKFRLMLGQEWPEVEDLSIRVSSADGSVLIERWKEFDETLPAGLYSVRTSLYGSSALEYIRLAKDTKKAVRAPRRWSVAPYEDAVEHHEYLQSPARALSSPYYQKAQGFNRDDHASLMLFFRTANPGERLPEGFLESISIRDKDGSLVNTLDKVNVTKQDGPSWVGFSGHIQPGDYELCSDFSGGQPRSIILRLQQGWQLSVFVGVDKQGAQLNGASMISSGMEQLLDFSATQGNPSYMTDLAMTALRSSKSAVPGGVRFIHRVLGEKFTDPILGLLGAHLLCRQGTRDENLVRMVLDNLRYLLPESGDVWALKWRWATEGLTEFPVGPCPSVPILRLSWEYLLAAAEEFDAALPVGNFSDWVSTNLFDDSIWTTWVPEIRRGHFKLSEPEVVAFNAGAAFIRPGRGVPSWIQGYLDMAAERGEKFSAIELSRALKIPKRVAEAALGRGPEFGPELEPTNGGPMLLG